MALVALVTFGVLSVPASPFAFAGLDLRVGLALLCGVLFAFAVGLLARGHRVDEPGSPPWRTGNPKFGEWMVWAIGISGTGLIAFACLAGAYLILRSTTG